MAAAEARMARMSKKALSRSCRAILLGVVVASAVTGGVGCGSSELETGYKPRPLSSSDAQRKAFYAPEYSREAAMAAQQHPQQGNDAGSMGRHRPGAPY
jgi:hypothetical protein